MLGRLRDVGLTTDEALRVRRIAMTLHRWAELECGDGDHWKSWAIERDEETDKPFFCVYPHDRESYRRPYPDKEKGALERLRKLMESHPELTWYHQTDPRGASLYIIRRSDLNGGDVHQLYTRGVAVYR